MYCSPLLRYAVVPTPLSRLCFWRLVLDEAQQVQGSTVKAAEMTRLVQATHRWAVTGLRTWGTQAGRSDCQGLPNPCDVEKRHGGHALTRRLS